jgi:copper(I)-binding protein
MRLIAAFRRLAHACCFAPLLVSATMAAQPNVEVTRAWVRATVPGQNVGGLYMDIRSHAAARLVAVSSPAAATAEIHHMRLENGVMKMSAVAGVDLPPGQTVKLVPGGPHVMLIDLKQPLAVGDSVPVTLTIENDKKTRQTLEVKAEVRDVIGGKPAR